MFNDYIYLDNNTIRRYCQKLSVRIPKLTQSKQRTLKNKEANIIEDAYKTEVSEEEEIIEQYSQEVNNEIIFEKFEESLFELNDEKYFTDMTEDQTGCKEIEFIKKQSIIKFNGILSIPEEFGQVEFVKKILQNKEGKEMLLNSLEDNAPEKTLLKSLINENGNIPVFFQYGDYKLYANIKGNNFCNIKYIDFEDNLEEELTVVAKVEKIHPKGDRVLIYDVYKDLLELNRAMRRVMNTSPNDSIPEKIFIGGNCIRLSVLAVYK